MRKDAINVDRLLAYRHITNRRLNNRKRKTFRNRIRKKIAKEHGILVAARNT